MKDYDKDKESLCLTYWDMNNLYGWAISQELSLSGFKWIEEIFQFNKDFIKSYKEDSDKGFFLKADAQYREKLNELHNDLSNFL